MIIWVHLDPMIRRNVADDLVDVHIGLRTAACLPDNKWEFIIPLACADLFTGLRDDDRLLFAEQAVFKIRFGASLFEISKGGNNLLRLALAANPKVVLTTLRLCAPVAIGRYPYLDRKSVV